MTLRCVDAHVTVGGRILLKNVSATLQPGRFVAILGPNGAGKSTLLSLLSAQRKPGAGQIYMDETPLGSMTPQDLALRRAVMPQESAVAFDFTAREVAELGRYPHRQRPDADEAEIVSRALDATGVTALASSIRFPVGKRRECSWLEPWLRCGYRYPTARRGGCCLTSPRLPWILRTSTRHSACCAPGPTSRAWG